MLAVLEKYKGEYILNNKSSAPITYTINKGTMCSVFKTRKPSYEISPNSKEVISIANNSNANLNFTISLKNSYRKFISDGIFKSVTNTLEGNTKLSLSFLNEDGDYEIIVEGENYKDLFLLSNYSELKKRILTDIYNLIKNKDSCGNDNIKKDCLTYDLQKILQYQNVFNALLFYSFLSDTTSVTSAIYKSFFKNVSSLYKIDLYNRLQTQTLSLEYYGKVVGSNDLFRKMLAIHYLYFYLSDIYCVEDKEENDFIEELYKLKELKKDIEALGLDVDKLETIFNESIYENNIPPKIASTNTIYLQAMDEKYIFSENDFLQDYYSQTNTYAESIEIKKLPPYGLLEFDDIPISENYIIKVTDIGRLSYRPTNFFHSNSFDLITFIAINKEDKLNYVFKQNSNLGSINVVVKNVPLINTLLTRELPLYKVDEATILEEKVVVSYTGGNGKAYKQGDFIASENITGLTLQLQEGTLTNGEGGYLYFELKGKPSKTIGKAYFNIQFAGVTDVIIVQLQDKNLSYV